MIQICKDIPCSAGKTICCTMCLEKESCISACEACGSGDCLYRQVRKVAAAVPKPTRSKKKRLVNGYKSKPSRTCFYCSTGSAERHEVFGGSNRQTSIKEGFQVDLCSGCHRAIHESVDEMWKGRRLSFQRYYQKLHESRLISELGISKDDARSRWIKLMGRSYL